MTIMGMGDHALAERLGFDPLEVGGQMVEAAQLARAHYPPLDPDRPALVVGLDGAAMAGEVRQKLLLQYPPEHEVKWLGATGAAVASLAELDRASMDDASALYVPPLARPGWLASFAEIIARLRAPDGCPWDREQTPQSLRRYLLEEAYEALEAIDLNQPPRLKEELGDLLFQIVLQSQIASEGGHFKLTDVIANIHAKIVRRHPHVFGDLPGATAREIEENWEKIKRAEKEDGAGVASFFRDIPQGLPALAEAEDMQQRAWRVNLWNDSDAEAGAQTAQALGRWEEQHDSRALGEALFMLVDQARRSGLDAESALREANRRFAASATAKPPV
ncbi:MAG: nucleoside triphosphate pyrophosphohydrolase [Chloroflexi bacterium]|nr:nucleoside triphosphate pyrophosphohydrolase [Chloroflexota bacterium]